MKKIYKPIIIMIVVLMVLILVIVAVLLILKNNKSDYNKDIENPNQIGKIIDENKINNELQEFDDTNVYFAVKNIIESYYTKCKDLNVNSENVPSGNRKTKPSIEEREEYAKKMQEEALDKLYNMLSGDYIKEFKINKQDVKEKFGTEDKYEPIIEKIYRFQNSTNVWTYLVKGINVDLMNEKSESYSIGVTIDSYNKTFCIYPQEYLEKHEYDKLKLDEEVDFEIEEIEKNNQNTYTYEMVDEEEICEEYFNKSKKILLFDADFAYEMLDDEYREKRFNGDKENFKEWLQNDYDNIRSSVNSKYKATTEKGSTLYICQDTNDNYWIFKDTKTVDCNILLDTYTLPINEIKDNYQKADDKNKAKMNIQNVFQAINRKDYGYVYDHLDGTFKQNNFDNLQKLEDYLKNNLFDINEIDGDNYSNEGEVQIFNLNVTHKNKDSMRKNMNINMKLKENNDFIMSFSIGR